MSILTLFSMILKRSHEAKSSCHPFNYRECLYRSLHGVVDQPSGNDLYRGHLRLLALNKKRYLSEELVEKEISDIDIWFRLLRAPARIARFAGLELGAIWGPTVADRLILRLATHDGAASGTASVARRTLTSSNVSLVSPRHAVFLKSSATAAR